VKRIRVLMTLVEKSKEIAMTSPEHSITPPRQEHASEARSTTLVSVVGFGPLIDALERAERKGYMPDAIADEWAAFTYMPVDEEINRLQTEAYAEGRRDEREEWETAPSTKWGALYKAAGMAMARIGMEGELDRRDAMVEGLMDALHALDGGTFNASLAGEADERIEAPEPFLCIAPACDSDCSGCSRAISAQDSRTYAIRYAYLRSRPVDTIALDRGGVFAGMVPQKLVLNGSDLDAEIDKAMTPDWAEATAPASKAACNVKDDAAE
jgi:hypothetical protein